MNDICLDCKKYNQMTSAAITKANSAYDAVLEVKNANKSCRVTCEMQIIVGKKRANEVKETVKQLCEENKLVPVLAVLQVGNDPASSTYIKNKRIACEFCGIICKDIHFGETISEEELIKEIKTLNNDPGINGILVQLPLPKHITSYAVINAIDPVKDVDGFTTENIGKLLIGEPCFKPCTPAGIIDLLHTVVNDLTGLNAVVIGRSNIVGKPVSILLLQENANVTTLHSKTKPEDLRQYCEKADIIVVATGHENTLPELKRHKNPIIIDVGIHCNTEGKLTGDVPENIKKKYSSYYTPVPGGVGPMTVALLMYNTYSAAKLQRGY